SARRRRRKRQDYGTIPSIRIEEAGGKIRATGEGVRSIWQTNIVALLWLGAVCCVNGCNSNRDLVSSTIQPNPNIRRVYVDANGPDKAVRRFEQFLDIALDDFGMTKVNEPRNADITLDISIREKEAKETVTATFVQADF